MNFEEHAAKPLLAGVGIALPPSELADTPDAVAIAAGRIGPCVVKAQVPTGKRGKAGGVKFAASVDEAREHAASILGMNISGHRVKKVLVEGAVDIGRELYAAVLNDAASGSPMVMFSVDGGMDIEAVAAETPERLHTHVVDIRAGFELPAAHALVAKADVGAAAEGVADVLVRLYAAYVGNDAELLEVNPLVVTTAGELVALDAKFVLDDSAIKRRAELAERGAPEPLTDLEARAEAAGIKYIELDGNVGVLANGAGLTMTTMDVVRHHGGAPANFCEIGGEAYTKAKTALQIVLAKPGVAALVVNFCGAFARCDVMMEGLLNAWRELQPNTPVFFSIAGTGDEEAIAMLKDGLDMAPLPDMSAACAAAVEAVK